MVRWLDNRREVGVELREEEEEEERAKTCKDGGRVPHHKCTS